MAENQYHEPPDELSQETRTFARMIQSLIEEAEAIDWYEQRLDVEHDAQARAIMENAQQEEFKHFAMDLEALLRRTPRWRATAEGILFQPGDIVENGEAAEAASEDIGNGDDAPPEGSGAVKVAAGARVGNGSLGIGSLKGEGR